MREKKVQILLEKGYIIINQNDDKTTLKKERGTIADVDKWGKVIYTEPYEN